MILSLNMMHVDKNVCDSVIKTLLNIQDNINDSKNACLDMVDMNIRQELTSKEITYFPLACHTLSRKERKKNCECLHGIKVSQGYSSNVKKRLSVKDHKLIGLKSHDCHDLMQQLLSMTICGILSKNIRKNIIRLYLFFNVIGNKVIDPKIKMKL